MAESPCNKSCPCDAFVELQHQVREHERRLAEGDTSFALLRRDISTLTETCKESNEIIKTLQEVPNRRVESVIDTVIRWVVPLFLGWVISKGGVL